MDIFKHRNISIVNNTCKRGFGNVEQDHDKPSDCFSLVVFFDASDITAQCSID